MPGTLRSTTLLLLTLGPIAAAADSRPAHLRCEYRPQPLGLDEARPRLSWEVETGRRNWRQDGYRILVASRPEILAQDRGDLWDSGPVSSEQSIQIPYAGRALTSRQECCWKVKVWERDGQASEWSRPASWTMGLLEEGDWRGSWIGHGGDPEVLPLLRRDFEVSEPVTRALVFLCGLGFHELRLNGEKVGDSVLDPGWTDYRDTCLYATFDVTGMLREGRNALGVMLGNGMYNVRGGRYVKFTGSFGDPKMILQLCIEHADGSTTTLASDGTWRTAPGPITFSCIYGGEDCDGRLQQPGWDRPGFDDSSWRPAVEVDGPGGRLVSQSAPPIRVRRVFRPVEVTEPRPGVLVYDLGQNFSGWPRIRVRGKAGSSVKLIPGELLDGEGLVSQKGSGGPATFTYTLRGEGTEAWHPRFTYYGFRYVQVEGAARSGSGATDGRPLLLDLEGCFTCSSAAGIGAFSCSDSLLNRIHQGIDMAILSNLQSVLTDCPHREKLGWLEVSHLMGPAVMYNYDVPLLYAKIIGDMRDAQLENGMVPDIAPEYVEFQGGFRDSPGWGSASILVPWLLYQRYDDRRALERSYDLMQRYLDYLESRAEEDVVSHGLGDWCDLGPKPYGAAQLTPVALTGTALYAWDAAVLYLTASILGREEEAKRHNDLTRAARRALNERFFDPRTSQYAAGSQTANAMPLAMGLVPKEHREAVLENLVADVRAQGNHMTGGDLGHRFLLCALMDAGRSDVIWDMTAQREHPSYGFQVEQGVTALSESWDPRHGLSQNHCMLGHVEEWFYRGLLGIDLDAPVGLRNTFVIRPQVVGDLRWAQGHCDTMHGRVASSWRIQGDRIRVEVTIPANTQAEIHLPDCDVSRIKENGKPLPEVGGILWRFKHPHEAVLEVGSGTWRFSAPLH